MLMRLYYKLRPLIPRPLQIIVRRQFSSRKRRLYKHVWPIDQKAGEAPEWWNGWPGHKQFALVLTHDVDTARGHARCYELMEMEQELGFVSSFNFVPERYRVSRELRSHLTARGFEVGVHGLNHDGRLFQSVRIFQERTDKINWYLRDWNAVGFRSPAMHRNLDWMHDLNIEYDLSTFDTDPFEPQPDGVGTIFPFWVKAPYAMRGFVELPCTLPQDFVLFVLLNEKNIDIWKRKLDWISEKGGMALLNTHPDYMNFSGEKTGLEEFPVQYYLDFLNYVKLRYNDQYWHSLPHEISSFYKNTINDKSKEKEPVQKDDL
jgi:hypothetical protein